MEYNLEQIDEFQKFIAKDPIINKQPIKSIQIIQQLYKIADKKEQLNFYLENLENIYDYFYDGTVECWETYDIVVYFIEKKEITNNHCISEI
jgi:hypothetical protein